MKKDREPLRVIVAMSGGVDSSVAAAMLVEAGFEVVGVMLGLWSDPSSENLCCTPDSRTIAKQIANIYGFPFHYVDAMDRFRNKVVADFINSYKKGNTPNPCIVCNRQIRWKILNNIADDFGASFIATGHYARIQLGDSGKVELLKGLDPSKDQSYVLHGLTQEQLRKTRFPIGSFSKQNIRKYAAEHNLPVADRPDSQDLCFVGNEGYRDFLIRHAPEVVDPGPIVTKNGRQIGVHSGLAFYTIGQRKGLGVAASRPFYVIEKDIIHNTLIVGNLEELGQDELTAAEVNWISGSLPTNPFKASVKIRYKSQEVNALIAPSKNYRVQIKFETPLRDITPGQSAVIYDGVVCLGGGIII